MNESRAKHIPPGTANRPIGRLARRRAAEEANRIIKYCGLDFHAPHATAPAPPAARA